MDYGAAKNDALYGALLGEASWQDFVVRLADTAPDGKTAPFSYNMRQDDGLAMAAGLDLSASLFDAVNIGVIVAGKEGAVKTVSETAQNMLASGAPLAVTPLGGLRPRAPEVRAAFEAMLKRTYDGPKSVSFVSGGIKLSLIRVNKGRISMYFDGPAVVILMERPEQGESDFDITPFAALHGLSGAECRALLGVLNGDSAAEIAARAAVSHETVRSQLKSLYAKTGTGGQADLLRLFFNRRIRGL